MPSLDKVRQSYHRQMELLVGIKVELDEAMKDFTLGHDAGLSALRSSTGKLGTRGTGSDTTAQATYEFHRMQGACSFAAGLILGSEGKLRQSERSLERAGSAILNAWLDTDPEIGPERRAVRQAAVDGQLTLENHTDGSIIQPAVSSDDAGKASV
jgi:hypothetical protein